MSDYRAHNDKIVDQHTRHAPGYAKLVGEMANESRASRAEAIGVRPQDRLLDIACGSGSLTLELAPHIAHATGLDLTPAMLDQARNAQAHCGANNVEWVRGDAASLPFPDETFTLVTCSAAFHHFGNAREILAEMARVCSPGGRIVVMDVTPDADKTGAYDRMEKMRDPSHGHAHSLVELCEMGAALQLGEPVTQFRRTPLMPYEAVLATSHPEQYSREELLELMRQDAHSGDDHYGFNATIEDEKVMVSYPMSTVIWTKPHALKPA